MGEAVNKTQRLAAMFKALGDPARLKIFEFLCSASCNPMAVEETGDVHLVTGTTVGDVCCRITGEEKVTSTISQQLKQLRHVGLITMERRGKNMICSVNQDALKILEGFMEECTDGTINDACCPDP